MREKSSQSAQIYPPGRYTGYIIIFMDSLKLTSKYIICSLYITGIHGFTNAPGRMP